MYIYIKKKIIQKNEVYIIKTKQPYRTSGQQTGISPNEIPSPLLPSPVKHFPRSSRKSLIMELCRSTRDPFTVRNSMSDGWTGPATVRNVNST